jgi:hypothetical protein
MGQNQLTGVSKVYPWEALLFQQFQELLLSFKSKRRNINSCTVQNTKNGDSHPGHIHANTAAQGGEFVFSFKPVTGGTGLTLQISKLDNGTAFGYDQLLTFNGYINFPSKYYYLGYSCCSRRYWPK